MSRFPLPHDPDHERAAERSEIESLLSETRQRAPSAAFRDRVLASMAVADAERRVVVAEHRRPRSAPPVRVVPEAIVGAAAAILVLAAPWFVAFRGTTARAAPEAKTIGAIRSDEAPDVHRALELLDARRDLFAAVRASDRDTL